ncbi:MAG: hypothetical protein WCK58_15870 [Chloroflexota bacterium]
MTATATTTAPVSRRRRIPPFVYGGLVVTVFAGVIGIGMASGSLQTTGRTTGDGRQVTLAGESSSEIKGWMTIGDVAAAFNVPLAEILAAFELPADTAPATALKDLESDLFSVSALRDWLEARPAATP